MPPCLPIPVGFHFNHPPPLQSDGQHLRLMMIIMMMTLTMVVVVIIIHLFVIMKPLLQILVIPSYANSESLSGTELTDIIPTHSNCQDYTHNYSSNIYINSGHLTQ